MKSWLTPCTNTSKEFICIQQSICFVRILARNVLKWNYFWKSLYGSLWFLCLFFLFLHFVFLWSYMLKLNCASLYWLQGYWEEKASESSKYLNVASFVIEIWKLSTKVEAIPMLSDGVFVFPYIVGNTLQLHMNDINNETINVSFRRDLITL